MEMSEGTSKNDPAQAGKHYLNCRRDKVNVAASYLKEFTGTVAVPSAVLSLFGGDQEDHDEMERRRERGEQEEKEEKEKERRGEAGEDKEEEKEQVKVEKEKQQPLDGTWRQVQTGTSGQGS